MSNINPLDVCADVNNAIERQAYEAGRESVCDILQATAPNSCEYWSEAACELHRQEKFYDALDCWREAEKHLANSEEIDDYWYQDLIRTLINATDQTGDSYFIEQAFYACERITAIKQTEELLNYKLELMQEIKPSREAVLELVEYILDSGFDVERKIDSRKIGIKGRPYQNDPINSYSDLAELYLWDDDVSEAFRIWSKAINVNKSAAKDKIASAIYMLVWYAEKHGFEESTFLPEEYGRLD